MLKLLVFGCCIALCFSQILTFNYTQAVDHFNESDSRTFLQQFQVYPNYYKPGGPIILIVGPERQIYPFEIYVSSVFSYFAPNLNGFIVATEHRYYGSSLPFGSDSFNLDSLKYLTINQSLADYESIISYIKYNSNYSSIFTPTTPVIAVGGSYGGFLSALLRIQYPDLFSASIASCTVPYLWALPNQGELWMDLMTETYLNQWPNSTCHDTLDAEFSSLVSSVQAGQTTSVQQSLSLCEAPTAQNYYKLDLYIKSAFNSIVMFNYPKPEVFCVARPFDDMCSFAENNQQSGNPWGNILYGLQLYYNRSGLLHCFDWEYTPTLPTGCHEEKSQSTTLFSQNTKSELSLQENTYDPWVYQSCTEFIYGAYGGAGLFHYGQNWTIVNSEHSCQTIIPGSIFNPYRPIIDPESNDSISFSNIIFSRAGFDQNRGWSLASDATDTVVEIYIETEAHTSDISNFDTFTSPALSAAMESELAYLSKWLQL